MRNRGFIGIGSRGTIGGIEYEHWGLGREIGVGGAQGRAEPPGVSGASVGVERRSETGETAGLHEAIEGIECEHRRTGPREGDRGWEGHGACGATEASGVDARAGGGRSEPEGAAGSRGATKPRGRGVRVPSGSVGLVQSWWVA